MPVYVLCLPLRHSPLTTLTTLLSQSYIHTNAHTHRWCLDGAKANFFLTEEELLKLYRYREGKNEGGNQDQEQQPPLAGEGANSSVQDLVLRSGGLQGPLFQETHLLEAALQKHGRRGFLMLRLEAERLRLQVEQQAATEEEEGAYVGARTVKERLALSRRAELVEEGRIADTPTSLVNTDEEGWWTIPAALAGFKLRWEGKRICMYLCIYVCMYVCMYVYKYIKRDTEKKILDFFA